MSAYMACNSAGLPGQEVQQEETAGNVPHDPVANGVAIQAGNQNLAINYSRQHEPMDDDPFRAPWSKFLGQGDTNAAGMAAGVQHADTSQLDGVTTTLKEIAEAIKLAANCVQKYGVELEEQVMNESDPRIKREAYERMGTNPLLTMHYHNSIHLANITSQLLGYKCSPSYSQVAGMRPAIAPGNTSADMPNHPSRKRRREDTQPTVAKFKLVMSPKCVAAEDPEKVYRRVVGNSRIQLADSSTKGREGRFLFYLREHSEEAMKKLQEGKYNGKKVTDLFNVFATMVATHSIRTRKFSKKTRDDQPFMVNGIFDHKEARQVLFDNNSLWFESQHDIDCVDLHVIPGDEDRYILEVFVSSRALRKFNSKSKDGRGPIDMGSKVVDAYVTERDDYCFRCLDPSHWWKNCKAKEPNCKFCEENHLSKECPVKKLPKQHVCRTCSNANAMRDADEEEDVNHTATSTKCPFVRKRMRQARMKSRVKSQKPKYVRDRK